MTPLNINAQKKYWFILYQKEKMSSEGACYDKEVKI
jgi:hypothetical protein